MKVIFFLLLLIFIVLNIFDVISTYRVVKLGSLHNERNLIARFFMKKFGILKGMLALKSTLLVIVPLMITYFNEAKKEMIVILAVADAVYLLAVINNFRINKYQRKRLRLNDF
ncbi:MAG: hypothetical protein CSB55_04900 [Candidatus Cloacimonadota bacterium]|nr:MAG: hypothetical protein CSB55_04900 [Candidatus Cloacimonadota bacterium]